MSAIRFEATLTTIGLWTILRLPKEASAKLPSRGQTMVEGAINGVHFQSALEPDGRGSHWLKMDDGLQKAAGANVGDPVTVSIEPSKKWPEPPVPEDVKNALSADTEVERLWTDITPMARWDWIRWIGATTNAETRQRRIAAAV
jgi:Domain of unknown function (DUF1905)/Bacteriocin-protection, YdeI or OmpD-Associated